MDMLILDVTDLPEMPRVGDKAELLGDQVTLGEVAAMAGTNEYEILTRLRRVPRYYDKAPAPAEAKTGNGASARAGATIENGASARAGATVEKDQ
jgi:Alanine racemase, C-terminal domain